MFLTLSICFAFVSLNYFQGSVFALIDSFFLLDLVCCSTPFSTQFSVHIIVLHSMISVYYILIFSISLLKFLQSSCIVLLTHVGTFMTSYFDFSVRSIIGLVSGDLS